MDDELLKRVASDASDDWVIRPVMLFFRGSFTSERGGEENFSEGVRMRMHDVLSAFRLPRHVALNRSLSAAVAAPRLKHHPVIYWLSSVT